MTIAITALLQGALRDLNAATIGIDVEGDATNQRRLVRIAEDIEKAIELSKKNPNIDKVLAVYSVSENSGKARIPSALFDMDHAAEAVAFGKGKGEWGGDVSPDPRFAIPNEDLECPGWYLLASEVPLTKNNGPDLTKLAKRKALSVLTFKEAQALGIKIDADDHAYLKKA